MDLFVSLQGFAFLSCAGENAKCATLPHPERYLRRLMSILAATTAMMAPKPAMAHGESTGTLAPLNAIQPHPGGWVGVPAIADPAEPSATMLANTRVDKIFIMNAPYDFIECVIASEFRGMLCLHQWFRRCAGVPRVLG